MYHYEVHRRNQFNSIFIVSTVTTDKQQHYYDKNNRVQLHKHIHRIHWQKSIVLFGRMVFWTSQLSINPYNYIEVGFSNYRWNTNNVLTESGKYLSTKKAYKTRERTVQHSYDPNDAISGQELPVDVHRSRCPPCSNLVSRVLSLCDPTNSVPLSNNNSCSTPSIVAPCPTKSCH